MQKKYRTQRIDQTKIINSLENIYISPLEQCNLNCKYCYTPKTKNFLSNKQILSFVSRYNNYLKNRSHDFLGTLKVATDSQEEKKYVKNCDIQLKSIIFCGGEVFTLKNFPRLVNNLISKDIFITIITNGTINQLKKIKNPKSCQLIVSLDGPQKIHDQNRGQGNFKNSYNFVKHALSLGFPVEIFYLITKDSYPYRNKLNIFNLKKTYLTDRLGSLNSKQVINIRQNFPCYPPRNFGCAMLSLQSDGKFYPCCESQKSIASLSDPISKILSSYISVYQNSPLCPDPNYFCNLK